MNNHVGIRIDRQYVLKAAGQNSENLTGSTTCIEQITVTIETAPLHQEVNDGFRIRSPIGSVVGRRSSKQSVSTPAELESLPRKFLSHGWCITRVCDHR